MKGRLIVGWVFRLFVGWWLTIKSEVYLPHQTEPQKYNNEPDPNYKIPSAQHKSLWQGEKSWKHKFKFLDKTWKYQKDQEVNIEGFAFHLLAYGLCT